MNVADYDLPAVEAVRLVAQAEIDRQKSAVTRNRMGQFATPTALAVDIATAVAAYASVQEPIHFGEPAIGTGSFLNAVLQAFPAERIVSATGFEIDPPFARAACDLWGRFGLHVIEGDFTEPEVRSQAPYRPTLVLTNPPYVRHHHLDPPQKMRLQTQVARTVGISVNGLAGLYVYYLLLAHEWLADGGLAAWLIPSEFMDVKYGQALKRYLTESVTLLSIHRYDPDDVQFTEALVSSAVVLFRKAPPMPGTRARFTYGGTMTKPSLIEEVEIASLRQAHKWTAFPRRPEHRQELDRQGDEVALSDLFRIQRGLATGANEFFILTREEARRLNLPESCLRPILPSPRYLRSTIIESDPDGYPQLIPQRVLIDCDLPEHQLQARHPALWSYFQNAQARGILNRYLVKMRTPWYRQEQRGPAPFLCTYMGRGVDEAHPFRFLLNRSRAVVPNVYLALYPKEPLAGLLKARPELYSLVFDLLQQITARELREEGRVYGGGLHKIEPNELGRIPAHLFLKAIPDLVPHRLQQLSLLDPAS